MTTTTTNEYRCTRSTIYKPGCPGFTDPRSQTAALQGREAFTAAEWKVDA